MAIDLDCGGTSSYLDVPDNINDDEPEQQLGSNCFGVVATGAHVHDAVDGEEVERVEGDDVVEDVVVVHDHAQEDHKEVEAPHHLSECIVVVQ